MKYSIYQIKSEKTRALGFLPLDSFKKVTKQPEAIKLTGTYSKVYSGTIEDYKSNEIALEALFYTFNMEHPEDFTGRSMSVGDIVKLDDSYYYCDSFSWELQLVED